MDDEQDITDAAWAQQEMDERHRLEDEALERHKALRAELRQMIDDSDARSKHFNSLFRGART